MFELQTSWLERRTEASRLRVFQHVRNDDVQPPGWWLESGRALA